MPTPFPDIASTLAPRALIEDILPGFNIGSISECQSYSGGFNHTCRVKTSHGRTYYLRAYRMRWRTLEDILYEQDVLNQLKSKGFPAAQPGRYKDGNDYCPVSAPEGRRFLLLFTEAHGAEITYDHDGEWLFQGSPGADADNL